MLTVVLPFHVYNKNMQDEEYFEGWPESYYRIPSARTKERVLKKYIETYHQKEDEERLQIFKKRYKRVHGEYVDQFIQAFLSLQQMVDNKMTILNRKKYNDAVVVDIMNLCLYDNPTDLLVEEWKWFLKDYIAASYRSFSRPAFLGMGKRTEDIVWQNVEKNLESMLVQLPHRFLLDEKCSTLYALAQEELQNAKG